VATDPSVPSPQSQVASAGESLSPEGTSARPGQVGLPFLLVGVGAGAGGREAFREVLAHLPGDAGLSFLLVERPQGRAEAPRVLGEEPLTVVEASDGLRLEANRIYLIPPGTNAALSDGCLTLRPQPCGPRRFAPADHLFRSLAANQQERATGVLLSGEGGDGVLGLQAIRGTGGFAFAQEARPPYHRGLPRCAADGVVDQVLTPAGIARSLLALAGHAEALAAELGGPAVVDEVLNLLQLVSGVDFSGYQRDLISRRVRRRMALHGLSGVSDYLKQLRAEPAEVRALGQDCLFRETRFFRDEEVFERLKEEVFPNLVLDRSPNTPLRVWMPGCGRGEEVYSLAIALLEFLGERDSNLPIRILATDVSEAGLEKARAGTYPETIEADVSPERLRRFFARVDGSYQIGRAIRNLCVFSRHNPATDPPFSRLDLVICRDGLACLEPFARQRTISALHYALNRGGYLLTGPEEPLDRTEGFVAVGQPHGLYTPTPLPSGSRPLDFGDWTESAERRPQPPLMFWSALDVQKEADCAVLARYAPAGVVINENLTVLQFRGHTTPYLVPGLNSLDLLRLLREELREGARAAVERATAENVPVRCEGVALGEGHGRSLVHLEVIPLRGSAAGVRCLLVLFEDSSLPVLRTEAAKASLLPGAEEVAAEQQVLRLQQELAATRDRLRVLTEEHEAVCEEMRSANEEMLSCNERLQSACEDHQVSREEMLSADEELTVLNEELTYRNQELARANEQLSGLFAALNLPVVLVGRGLRIRQFTPEAERLWNLIPEDVGRSLGDLNPNFCVPNLAELTERVIDSLIAEEHEVWDREGQGYLPSIQPYVAAEIRVDGAALTLLQIDSLKRSRQLALR
jgi:two-component system CheB/CheR fusion protein